MIRQNQRKVVLFQQVPYICELLFIILTRLSCRFFRIVKYSSIHRLQLGLVNVFIAKIGLNFFTNLNVMHLRRYVLNIIDSKWCLKRAANEFDFFLFLRRYRRSEKWTSLIYLECLMSIIYINSITHRAFNS